MKNRRTLMLGLGASALTAPFAALAQQPNAPAGPPGKVWRLGFLADHGRPISIEAHFQGALARGLRELGYVEGKNLAMEYRYAENRPELLNVLATELVQMKVDAIVLFGTIPTKAAQQATSAIPLVFVGPGDPVGFGLVKSLARPGGNTTGLSSMTTDLGPKRLEMLLAMMAPVVPKISQLAVLVNPSAAPTLRYFDGLRTAADKLGVSLKRIDASTPQEIDTAFSSIKRDAKTGAVMVSLNPLFQQQKDQIGELSLKHRLPSMAADRMYAEAGCLMSYGSSLEDMLRYAATYVDKIFKGRKPSELPVEQPTRFELVINGKTAKALGLKIPQSLLISAERVIE